MAAGSRILVEACVDSLASAAAAVAGGAERLELCGGLVEGGLTPSAGMVAMVRERVDATLHMLIRPRAGDFLYSEDEVLVMLADIDLAMRLGADGVVIGALRSDGTVDAECTERMVGAARPMAVTFHRAFDLARDPAEALDALMVLGVERVLTSGQAAIAEAGIPVIKAMVERSAGRIAIVAGGGVHEGNAARIVAETGVGEIHVRGSRTDPSAMTFRREGVYMGRGYSPDEYRRVETDAVRVRNVVAAVRGEAQGR
jgi:copper homeostasis protein